MRITFFVTVPVALLVAFLLTGTARADTFTGFGGDIALGGEFAADSDWTEYETLDDDGLLPTGIHTTGTVGGVDYDATLLVGTRDGVITFEAIALDDTSAKTRKAVEKSIRDRYSKKYKVTFDNRSDKGDLLLDMQDDQGQILELVSRPYELILAFMTGDEYDRLSQDVDPEDAFVGWPPMPADGSAPSTPAE